MGMGNQEKEEEVMASPKYEYLSHKTMDAYYSEVIRSMANAGLVPDIIIALSRGGLDFGVKMSNYYDDARLVPLVWQTRDGDVQQVDQLRDIMSEVKGGNVVIVDDILDTGETLIQIEQEVRDFVGDADIYFAVAIENTEADFEVDFSAREIQRSEDTQWFVFPWENWWNNLQG